MNQTDLRYCERVAVLGSNSFAGACLIKRLLDDGASVIGFNRSPEGSPIFLQYLQSPNRGNYRFVQADINNDLDLISSEIRSFRPTAVADFAGQGMVAQSWDFPDQWYQTNILSKVRVHEMLRSCDSMKRYLRVSTPEVYGSQSELQKESWNYNPSTPYAVSHAAIDMSLRAYHQRYGFPVVFTRFANFYGPGQQLYRIIPKTIICALLNKKLPLHGGGHSVRAFIYGADVADAIVKAINDGVAGEIYHFSPTTFYTIREVVTTIAKSLGKELSDIADDVADRPSKDQAYLMDSSRARSELGWVDRFDLKSGIEQTKRWVESNLDEIKALPLDYVHKA